MSGVRWILTPVSAVAAFYTVFILGLLGVSLLTRFCPPELMVSGTCNAPWYERAVDALIVVSTALAAAGVVLVPALVAPALRFQVALFAFMCGAALALYLAVQSAEWMAFAVAVLAGAAALWFVGSQWRSR